MKGKKNLLIILLIEFGATKNIVKKLCDKGGYFLSLTS